MQMALRERKYNQVNYIKTFKESEKCSLNYMPFFIYLRHLTKVLSNCEE